MNTTLTAPSIWNEQRTSERTLTNAAPVEHQVACHEVSEAPEERRATEERDTRVDIEQRRRHAREDRVVRRRGPEPRVALGLGALPERERVGDPVCEEQP